MIFQPELETLPRAELERLQRERLRARFGIDPGVAAGAAVPGRSPICATPTRSGCCGAASRSASASTPRPARAARRRSSRTRATTSPCGPTAARARSRPPAAGPGTLVHVAYGYGLFTGGLGLHYGAERLGCTVVPASSGNTPRQAQLLEDLGARDPLLHAELRARDRRARRRRSTRLKPPRRRSSAPSRGRSGSAAAIEDALDLTALDIYGLSEIVGPACRLGVRRGTRRRARERGPLPRRGRRPGDGASRSRRRGRRARVHDAHEGGAPAAALPHRRPRVARRGSRACAGGRFARMSRVVGRTDDMLDHPRRQRLPERDRARAARASTASSRTTSSSSSATSISTS